MKKRWILLFVIAAGIGAAFYFHRKQEPKADASKSPANQKIPVQIGTAGLEDVPIWLTGIGTTQASNTVTVRPRVGGSLDKVNFTEGALVKSGDVLAEIDPRPFQSVLSQAQAKKAQDEAQLANARLEAARFQNLLKSDAVSQQQLDLANATAGQLAALIQADQAAIEAAQLDLDFTTVRAPISGRTGVRSVDAGNLVTANQTTGIVVITELQPISVIFTIPQQHLAALRKDMKPGAKPLTVEALNQDGELLERGELELVDNQIDTMTGTLRLKATFKNADLSLWPGQFVSARVLVETRKDAVVVPNEAVKPGLEGPYCYVVKSDDSVEVRIVKPGPKTDEGLVIEEGLKGGERVVLVGQNKLRPGSKVASQDKTP